MHAWVDASYREFSISFTYFSREPVTLILAVAVHLNKVLENIFLFSLFFKKIYFLIMQLLRSISGSDRIFSSHWWDYKERWQNLLYGQWEGELLFQLLSLFYTFNLKICGITLSKNNFTYMCLHLVYLFCCKLL